MNRRYVLTAAFLGIAACATSGPEHPETVAGTDNSVTNGAPPTTTDDVKVADIPDLEVADIPEVPKVTDIPVRDEIVCSREKRTGTNRVIKVCRSRSSINRTSAEAKETFDDLRRSQVEYP